ncbi:hypothetical protein CTEN210_13539 [Chaetoceros tenuissimus]|uniref:Peptidase S1 domain-containing protein n=1 Tax=Chaetoceros tenuissimus TaxID=426638 RepID=A0AAD3HBI3_9STRA|nr:hypothetical protein CTEN210_13539 [Chaetoceros tenuissimus]
MNFNKEDQPPRSKKKVTFCVFLGIAMTSLIIAGIVWWYGGGDRPCIVPLKLNPDGSKPNCNGEEEEKQETETLIEEAEKEQGQRNLSIDHDDLTQIVNKTQPIINGQDAGWDEYPWFVILGTGCSGSLIAQEYVLTAAHCVDKEVNGQKPQPIDPKTLTIKVGARNSTVFKEKFDASEIYIHKRWSGKVFGGGDIAVVKLNGKSSVEPINVYPKFMVRSRVYNWKNSDSLKIIGYGFVKPNIAELPSIHQELDVILLSYRQNRRNYGRRSGRFYAKNTIAVKGEKANSGACYGDSGGPLFDAKSNSIHGVASYGIDIPTEGFHCDTNYPTYYTMTEKYLSFISDHVCKSESSNSLALCYKGKTAW